MFLELRSISNALVVCFGQSLVNLVLMVPDVWAMVNDRVLSLNASDGHRVHSLDLPVLCFVIHCHCLAVLDPV